MILEYQGKRPKIAASAFIAPNAVIIGDVEIGEEASIWFGVVVRGDNGPIRIGARANVQDNSVIHVGQKVRLTVLEEDVTVGHCAAMEDCVVGAGSVIGTGAVILNGAKIGSQTLIAAGSVVAQNAEIPDRVLAAGAPAVVKKQLDGDAGIWVARTAEEYVKLSRTYMAVKERS